MNIKNTIVLSLLITFLFQPLFSLYCGIYLYAQWQEIPKPWLASYIKCFSGSSGPNIYAGTENGYILSSNDSGSSWASLINPIPGNFISSLAVKDSIIFVGTTSGGEFFATSDTGMSWTGANLGTSIQSLIIKDTILFAGTGWGVRKSSDNGATWSFIGLPGSIVMALAFRESDFFAATDSGVFLSTNYGLTWSPAGLTNEYVLSLAISGTNIFAGTGHGIFLSTDNGVTWTPVNNGLTDSIIRCFAISGNAVFAGTNSTGVFLSTDYGTTWKAINDGLTSFYIYALFIIGDNILAGNNRIWKRNLSEILSANEVRYLEKEPIIIYRNPIRNNLSLQFQTPSSASAQFMLYDFTGKQIALSPLCPFTPSYLPPGTHSITFSTSHLPPGLYFLVAIINGKIQTKKIIKM